MIEFGEKLTDLVLVDFVGPDGGIRWHPGLGQSCDEKVGPRGGPFGLRWIRRARPDGGCHSGNVGRWEN